MGKYSIGTASNNRYVRMLDGIERTTLVHGEHTLLCEFRIEKGAEIPIHKHPQEQTGYLLSGHMVFTINGQNHEVKPGGSWNIKGDIEHGALAKEDSVVLEVFSPIREDFLDS